MLRAVIQDDTPHNQNVPTLTTPPPPDVVPGTNMFLPPHQAKLNFYNSQIKWILAQKDISESFKQQLYKDTLTKALELQDKIKGPKQPLIPSPPAKKAEPDTPLNKVLDKFNIKVSKKEGKKKLKKKKAKAKNLSPIANRTKSKTRGYDFSAVDWDVLPYGGYAIKP